MENPIQKIPGLTEVISEFGYGRKLKILQDIVITIRKKLNWSPTQPLYDGLIKTYKWINSKI